MYTHGVRIQLDVAVRQPCPQTLVRALAHVPIEPAASEQQRTAAGYARRRPVRFVCPSDAKRAATNTCDHHSN